MFTYEYPRPIVSTDIVLLDGNKVLLIKRGIEPFKDCWALPGGHVGDNENSKMACVRELKEETGLIVEEKNLYILDVVEDEWRDPRRQWCMSIVYACENFTGNLKAGDDASQAEWFLVNEVKNMNLAFDHAKILKKL